MFWGLRTGSVKHHSQVPKRRLTSARPLGLRAPDIMRSTNTDRARALEAAEEAAGAGDRHAQVFAPVDID